MRTTTAVALLAVVVVAMAASCSGDPSTSSGGTATSSVEPVPSATATPAESTPTSGPTTAPDGTAASPTGFAVDTGACADPASATAPIEGPLRIGTSIPQTGGAAVIYAPFGAAQQAFVDHHNAESGGLGGRPIELVATDDRLRPDLTVANVEALLDDDVTLVAGVLGSENNLAIRDRLGERCVPHLWAVAPAPELGDIDRYPWSTGLSVPTVVESRVWADHVAATAGTGAAVAVYHVADAAGRADADRFVADATVAGLTVVADESVPVDDVVRPSEQMAVFVEARPSAIFALPRGAQCVAFLIELGRARAEHPDFDPEVYLAADCAQPLFFAATQNGGAEGVFTSSNLEDLGDPVRVDEPGVKTYLDAMATYAPDVDATDRTALAGWLSMEMAVHAAQTAFERDEYTRAGIIDAARTIEFTPALFLDGLTARMDAGDAYVAEGTQLLRWSDGSGRFVAVGEVVDLDGTFGTFPP